MRFIKNKRKIEYNEEETKEEPQLQSQTNPEKLDTMLEKLTVGGNLKMMSQKKILKKFKI